MDHRSEAGIIRHPQAGVVAVEPADGHLQREAAVEAGGAGIAHDLLFRLAGGFREVLEGWGQEREVGTHQAMNLSYQLKYGETSGKSVNISEKPGYAELQNPDGGFLPKNFL